MYASKRLHHAIHVEKKLAIKLLQECKGTTRVRVLESICGVLNLHDTSIGNNGELFFGEFELCTSVQGLSTWFLVEKGPTISDYVHIGVRKCWDLGSLEESIFTCIDTHFGSCTTFLWDPSLPESLHSSGFLRVDIDSAPVCHVAFEGIQQRLWDPGLAGVSKLVLITRIWVNFASRPAFPWDPGSARHLLSISLVRCNADFNPPHQHELGLVWQCFIVSNTTEVWWDD
jgi:hypothetical protein